MYWVTKWREGACGGSDKEREAEMGEAVHRVAFPKSLGGEVDLIRVEGGVACLVLRQFFCLPGKITSHSD